MGRGRKDTFAPTKIRGKGGGDRSPASPGSDLYVLKNVCVYLCICTHICEIILDCLYLVVIYPCVCIFIICMCKCIYACTRVCMYICVCMHVYVHVLEWFSRCLPVGQLADPSINCPVHLINLPTGMLIDQIYNLSTGVLTKWIRHIYACICVCTHVYMYTRMCTCIRKCTYEYVRICTCMYKCVRSCTHVCVYARVSVFDLGCACYAY